MVNRSIAANTIVVYAGGRDLPANQAGVGGFGGYDGGGSSTFLDILDGRGQAGALLATPTDFGQWGGAITFDTVGTTWHFGTTTSGLDGTKVDFLTVAEHELAHLFGFGTAPSWQNQISGSNFTGPVSKAANGNVNVPLGDSGHWALSVTSNGELATMRPAACWASLRRGIASNSCMRSRSASSVGRRPPSEPSNGSSC